MATEELKKENQAQGLVFQERLKVDNPAEQLQKSIGGSLSQFGGFQVIKDLAKEADKMDPKRKAAKSIFLKEETYKEERAKLKNELAMWISILEGGEIQHPVMREGLLPTQAGVRRRSQGRSALPLISMAAGDGIRSITGRGVDPGVS